MDFNVRQGFWALVAKDDTKADRYASAAERKFRGEVGYHAPNGNMDESCTLGPRIASTPERDANTAEVLHKEALSVPGIQFVAYPLSCPEVSTNYVVMAAVNKSIQVEEYNYTTGPDLTIYGVANLRP